MQRSTRSLGIALVLLGLLLAYLGQRDLPATAADAAQPRVMTLGAFLAAGADAPTYVTLNDLAFSKDLAILPTVTSRVKKAWIPVLPSDREGNASTPLHVQTMNANRSGQSSSGGGGPVLAVDGRAKKTLLVATTQVTDRRQLERFCQQSSITGVIVNRSRPLPREERRRIEEGLPKFGAEGYVVLEENASPPHWLRAWGLVATGGLLALVGAALTLRGLWPRRAASRRRGDQDALRGWLQDVELQGRNSSS